MPPTDLLLAARAGDDTAFGRLGEFHRHKRHAHQTQRTPPQSRYASRVVVTWTAL